MKNYLGRKKKLQKFLMDFLWMSYQTSAYMLISSDWNEIWNQNHLNRKRTLNHLIKQVYLHGHADIQTSKT